MTTITADDLIFAPVNQPFPLFSIGPVKPVSTAVSSLKALRLKQNVDIEETFDNSSLDITATPSENPGRVVPALAPEPSRPLRS